MDLIYWHKYLLIKKPLFTFGYIPIIKFMI